MIKKIAPDKWKHFFVGIAMGIVLQLTGCWLLPEHFLLATALVLGFVVTISYVFELFSKITGQGHYEILDAVASIIGGVLGMTIVVLAAY
ncbi:MAG: hypothetical protein ABI813_12825 [Bacteroidota bacterium]